MVDFLSSDDIANIFKHRKRVHHIKNPLNLPFYGNFRGCPVGICCSSVTSVVGLAKSSSGHSRGSVLIMLRTLAMLAMFSTTDVTILHLAVFPESRLFEADTTTAPV